MDFYSMIGQNSLKNSLLRAIESGKTGHAYLFCGAKGIGKRTAARIFAALILCENAKAGRSCGECMPCRLMSCGTNPDYAEIDPGGTIGVDEIRAIQAEISLRPHYGDKKVYFVADAERMTVQAQNSLLKTLEEPPPYGVIILTTSNPSALLETIRSRTARYNLERNSIEEVQNLLIKKYSRNPEEAGFIASYSGGVIGKAIELSESQDFILIREKVFELLRRLKTNAPSGIFDVYTYFEEKKDEVERLLDIMLLYYRDLFILKNTGNENLLINCDKQDIILDDVQAYSKKELVRNIEIIEATRRSISQNANYRLAVEVMLMKLQEEAKW